MRPFLLNVFFSKRFVQAKVMHRGTSKVIAVATTNAKDLRFTFPLNACRTIGRLIAQRSMDSDVFAMAYEPRRMRRSRGSLELSSTPSRSMASSLPRHVFQGRSRVFCFVPISVSRKSLAY
jgi:ribosomal protein L18